jgi:hypothetical protein
LRSRLAEKRSWFSKRGDEALGRSRRIGPIGLFRGCWFVAESGRDCSLMMPIENIEDWEQRIRRQDAFWDCSVLDRPVVVMTLPKVEPVLPWPEEKAYASIRDRWMDTERMVQWALASAANTEFLGDALPIAWPNLGPELFSAFFGMEMEYTADTSWGVPNLDDWADADGLALSRDNFYWKKLLEATDALLEAGSGKYYAGFTDFHPGGDALAAFRDPMRLNLDMLTAVEDVKRLVQRLNAVYFDVFGFYAAKFRAADQAFTSWPGIVSSRTWYVPSNDFSCMVSKEMFDDVFLPGIVEECRHLEASIYHLDGPDALRHLDSLLGIKELNAIQWIYGAGRGVASDWLHVYRRCQDAGKGIQLHIGFEELDCIASNLKPEGVWMTVAVRDHAQAGQVLKRVGAWT